MCLYKIILTGNRLVRAKRIFPFSKLFWRPLILLRQPNYCQVCTVTFADTHPWLPCRTYSLQMILSSALTEWFSSVPCVATETNTLLEVKIKSHLDFRSMYFKLLVWILLLKWSLNSKKWSPAIGKCLDPMQPIKLIGLSVILCYTHQIIFFL